MSLADQETRSSSSSDDEGLGSLFGDDTRKKFNTRSNESVALLEGVESPEGLGKPVERLSKHQLKLLVQELQKNAEMQEKDLRLMNVEVVEKNETLDKFYKELQYKDEQVDYIQHELSQSEQKLKESIIKIATMKKEDQQDQTSSPNKEEKEPTLQDTNNDETTNLQSTIPPAPGVAGFRNILDKVNSNKNMLQKDIMNSPVIKKVKRRDWDGSRIPYQHEFIPQQRSLTPPVSPSNPILEVPCRMVSTPIISNDPNVPTQIVQVPVSNAGAQFTRNHFSNFKLKLPTCKKFGKMVDWAIQVEKAAVFNNIDLDDQLVRGLDFFLEGDALLWWENQRMLNPNLSWKEVKTLLLENFNQVQQFRDNLKNLSWKTGESIERLCQDTINMCLKNDPKMDFGIIKHHIIIKLDEKTRVKMRKVLEKEHIPLQKVLKKAKKVDLTLGTELRNDVKPKINFGAIKLDQEKQDLELQINALIMNNEEMRKDLIKQQEVMKAKEGQIKQAQKINSGLIQDEEEEIVKKVYYGDDHRRYGYNNGWDNHNYKTQQGQEKFNTFDRRNHFFRDPQYRTRNNYQHNNYQRNNPNNFNNSRFNYQSNYNNNNQLGYQNTGQFPNAQNHYDNDFNGRNSFNNNQNYNRNNYQNNYQNSQYQNNGNQNFNNNVNNSNYNRNQQNYDNINSNSSNPGLNNLDTNNAVKTRREEIQPLNLPNSPCNKCGSHNHVTALCDISQENLDLINSIRDDKVTQQDNVNNNQVRFRNSFNQIQLKNDEDKLQLNAIERVCDNKELIIKLWVEDTEVLAMVDTGADVNFIKKGLFPKFESNLDKKKVVLGDKSEVTSYGQVKFSALIGEDKLQYSLELEVLQELSYDIILGRKFLFQDNNFDVLTSKNGLWDNKFKKLIKFKDNRLILKSDKEYVIQPYETFHWIIETGGIIRNKNVLLEEAEKLHQKFNIVIASTICKDNKLVVHGQNLSNSKIVVPKNTKISTLNYLDSKNKIIKKESVVMSNSQNIKTLENNKIEDREGKIKVCDIQVDSNLKQEEVKEIVTIILNNEKAFSEKVGNCNAGFKHTIDLEPGTKPKNKPPRRGSLPKRKIIDGMVQSFIDEDLIEPSCSEWAAEVVLVIKPNGQHRFCIDYRDINKATIRDQYPLPKMEDLLGSLNEAAIFSSLDLTSGYFQINMAERDRYKTAFRTESGLFQWKRMPMGLCNAAASFQRAMDIILGGLKWIICLVYLDDVLVFGSNIIQHNIRLELVIKQIANVGLTFKLSKCKFGFLELKFLGFIISARGIRMDESKLEIIKNWKIPTTQKALKKFLSLANVYRRLIQNFAMISDCLWKKLGKIKVFELNEIEIQAFELIKSKLMEKPILNYPDLTRSYELYTDACTSGIGAVLKQGDNVISYFSRSLLKNEINYSTTELESLALVKAVKNLIPYLELSTFIVYLDHRAIEFIQKWKNSNSRLERWWLFLQRFNYSIKYIKGKDNVEADVLSRLYETDEIDRQDWQFDPFILSQILELFNVYPEIDLFASMLNRQFEKFFNINEDAFKQDWKSFKIVYLNPPWELLNKCLKKIIEEEIENVIIIAPIWNDKLFYKLILQHLIQDPIVLEASEDLFKPVSTNHQTGIKKTNYNFIAANISGKVKAGNWLSSHSLNLRKLDQPIVKVNRLNTLKVLDKQDLILQQKEDVSILKYFKKIELPINKKNIKYVIKNGVLCRCKETEIGLRYQIICPTNIRKQIFDIVHGSKTYGGHLGTRKTINKILQIYWWPNVYKIVEHWIKQCKVCQSHKKPKFYAKFGLLKNIIVERRFELLGIDFLEHLPTTKNGFKHLIVVSDYFSKWVITFPTKTKSSSELAKLLVKNLFLLYGSPENIISDRGKYFLSKLMNNVYLNLEINKKNTVAFHPQTDGLVERFNSTLVAMLAKVIEVNQKNWDECLPFVTYAYNTSVHESTKFSPFYLMFGREPRSGLSNYLEETGKEISVKESGDLITKRLEIAQNIVQQNLSTSRFKQKLNYDKSHFPVEFEEGELVLIQNLRIKKGQKEKLKRTWVGPFLIIEKLSELNYKVSLVEDKKKVFKTPISIQRMKIYIPNEEDKVPQDFKEIIQKDGTKELSFNLKEKNEKGGDNTFRVSFKDKEEFQMYQKFKNSEKDKEVREQIEEGDNEIENQISSEINEKEKGNELIIDRNISRITLDKELTKKILDKQKEREKEIREKKERIEEENREKKSVLREKRLKIIEEKKQKELKKQKEEEERKKKIITTSSGRVVKPILKD